MESMEKRMMELVHGLGKEMRESQEKLKERGENGDEISDSDRSWKFKKEMGEIKEGLQSSAQKINDIEQKT